MGVIDPNLDPNSKNLPIKTCVPGRRWAWPRKREIGNSGWYPALTIVMTDEPTDKPTEARHDHPEQTTVQTVTPCHACHAWK